MFLFERLFGVGLYALALVAACFFIATNNHKRGTVLFGYLVVLAAMAYFYVPYETADLYRIYGFLNTFRRFDFSMIWEERVINSPTGLANLYYWLISKTGVNNLLPAITTFICYGSIFYLIDRTAKINNASGKNVAISLMFCMSVGNYMFVVAGIRCMIGVSLLAFCFFRETCEKKRFIWHIPLYVISLFFHVFSFILFLLRLLVPLLISRKNSLYKITYVIVVATALTAAYVVFDLSDYVASVFEKAEEYVTGNMYSYFWEYVIGTMVGIVSLFFVVISKHSIRQSNLDLNDFYVYVKLLLVVAVCFCFEFTIFHRILTYICPIIITPILMTKLQQIDEKKKQNTAKVQIRVVNSNIGKNMLLFSLLILAVSCSRGSLSSLKFFVL